MKISATQGFYIEITKGKVNYKLLWCRGSDVINTLDVIFKIKLIFWSYIQHLELKIMHPDRRSKSVLKVNINLVGQRLWNFLDPGEIIFRKWILNIGLKWIKSVKWSPVSQGSSVFTELTGGWRYSYTKVWLQSNLSFNSIGSWDRISWQTEYGSVRMSSYQLENLYFFIGVLFIPLIAMGIIKLVSILAFVILSVPQ